MSRQNALDLLISQVAVDNQVAFSKLYIATSAKLFAVCLSVLNERASAEDALQEVYIKVWKNAYRYRITGNSPMTWLITIARNAAIDQLRKRKIDFDYSDVCEKIPSNGFSPEESAVATSEADRIVLCLSDLGENDRNAVIGAYLQGKTYKELAVEFDVPLNTIRTRLRRSLLTLRDAMAL